MKRHVLMLTIGMIALPGLALADACGTESVRRVSRSLRHSEVKFSEYSYLSFRFVDPDLLGKR